MRFIATALPIPPANIMATATKEGTESRASPERPWPLEVRGRIDADYNTSAQKKTASNTSYTAAGVPQ